jgi:antagonist of KipI
MIRVLEPGPLTSVQDLGRRGYLRYGIPESGPIDRTAFLLANRLVGNADDRAGLECTLQGPRLEILADGALAATGAEMALSVNDREAPAWRTVRVRAGDIVRLGPARTGVRGYLAFAGGLDLPPVLGSRATYLRGRLGGYNGRALRAGDEVGLGPASPPRLGRRVKAGAIPRYDGEATVRVVLGPQADRFTTEGIATFLAGTYEMLPQSDRMGARLRGPRIAHARGHDIVSDGVPLGGVQVVGDGQPIVLLADRQSTGGYTKIATVCSVDVGRIGQLRPGARLGFREVTVEVAHGLLREARAALGAAIEEDWMP